MVAEGVMGLASEKDRGVRDRCGQKKKGSFVERT